MTLRSKKYKDKEKLRITRNKQRARYYAKTAIYPNRKKWTMREVLMLFDNPLTDTELSAYIGRSVKAIQVKRCRLLDKRKICLSEGYDMKRDSMIELVKMYDAMEQVDEAQRLLTGSVDSLGYKDGIFGVFTHVFSIIRRECHKSLVNPTIDLEDNGYYKILHSGLTIEERVDALLAGVTIEEYASIQKYNEKKRTDWVDSFMTKFPGSREDVLTFISKVLWHSYPNNERVEGVYQLFSAGYCYYFAKMLEDAFGGEVCWHVNHGHIVWRDNNICYDIGGIFYDYGDGDIVTITDLGNDINCFKHID